MLIAARLALRCLAPSFAIRGTMMRAAAWVSPPPSQSRVKKESDQENGGQVDAEISLFGIGVHSPASEFLGHLLLCPGEKWHHDEGNTGQENSGNAVLSSFSTDDIGNGLIADVNTQCQEAEAYDPQTELLISFSSPHVSINCHSPKQHNAGSDPRQVQARTRPASGTSVVCGSPAAKKIKLSWTK